jgi:hypothetical protein
MSFIDDNFIICASKPSDIMLSCNAADCNARFIIECHLSAGFVYEAEGQQRAAINISKSRDRNRASKARLTAQRGR